MPNLPMAKSTSPATLAIAARRSRSALLRRPRARRNKGTDETALGLIPSAYLWEGAETRGSWRLIVVSEAQLQAQLQRSHAARADDGIAVQYVWRAAPAAESTGSSRIVLAQTTHATIRIGIVGMVQHIEECSTELCA